MQVDDELIVGAVATAVIGFVAFLIKIAAKSVLNGFSESLSAHARAINGMTDELKQVRHEVQELRVNMADFSARLRAVEGRDE